MYLCLSSIDTSAWRLISRVFDKYLTDLVVPLPLFSPEWVKPLSSASLQIDRPDFPSLIFCLQQSNSPLRCVSQENSWFHIMLLICHASVWADIQPRGHGSVGWCLLTGRGVDQLMAAVLYVQYIKSDTEPIADLLLYFIHCQELLPLENNGS